MRYVSRLLLRLLLLLLLLLGVGYVRLHMLNAKPLKPEAFSTVNLAEIYAIGAVMVVVGYAVSPEAAHEHWLLMRRHPPGAEVPMTSDAFGQSTVVAAATKRACRTRGEARLRWNQSVYVVTFDRSAYMERRAALALNGGRVECRGGRPRILVPVTYPKSNLVTFVQVQGVPLLQLEEGLIHILEERGWYHPYTAVYE